ncbi:sigma-54-dependent Fis family transcriptional regulator [candidate division FCPU426 bacterium]|nr:sigma-54-dependent Fis family transcriptional regulator [candidate division FCPU426 bacterium]
MNGKEKTNMQKVIIFSEDRALKDVLKKTLPSSKYQCDEVREKDALLNQASSAQNPLVVLDSRAVGGDMDLVSILQGQNLHRILWLAPQDRMANAAEAIRRGADFYLTLPLNENVFKQVLGEWEQEKGISEPQLLPVPEEIGLIEGKIIGRSEGMKRAFHMAARVAATDSSILITGETGVGKELVARAIHRLSSRAQRTFVAINCGAIPETLLESELFGFRKGAFTGATSDRAGLFEQADGGTFFMDEIGELSSALQVKLLRVLEDGKIRPLGGTDEIRVNVRILAATNRDLAGEALQGRFRRDLFYRVNVINIHIPPLRERKEDIPLLIKYFLQKYNERFNKNIISITRDALFFLMNYDYPGNIRELENIIQHGVLLADNNVIEKTSLPPQVFQRAQLALEGSRKEQSINMQQAEEELIKQALTRFDGNQTETARSLGISRSTLWRKIKAYKLENFK